MQFYLSIYFAVLLIGLLSREVYAQNEKPVFDWAPVACCLLLALVAAARSESVGADTYEYELIYQEIGSLHWHGLFTASGVNLNGVEPGYRLYNWLLYRISPAPQTITAVNSALLMAFVYRMISRRSKDPWLSVTLFLSLGLFQSALNLTPSAIASAFVFSRFDLIERRKPIRFAAAVIFAGLTFHTSAFFLIVFYCLDHVPLTSRRFAVLLAVGAILSLGVTTFVPNALSWLVPAKYLGYLTSVNNSWDKLLVGCELVLFALICRIVAGKGALFGRRSGGGLCNWAFLATMVAFMFAAGNQSWARLSLELTMYFVICVPEWLSIAPGGRANSRQRSLFISKYDFACFLVVVLSTAGYAARMAVNNIGSTIPYSMCFG